MIIGRTMNLQAEEVTIRQEQIQIKYKNNYKWKYKYKYKNDYSSNKMDIQAQGTTIRQRKQNRVLD